MSLSPFIATVGVSKSIKQTAIDLALKKRRCRNRERKTKQQKANENSN